MIRIGRFFRFIYILHSPCAGSVHIFLFPSKLVNTEKTTFAIHRPKCFTENSSSAFRQILFSIDCVQNPILRKKRTIHFNFYTIFLTVRKSFLSSIQAEIYTSPATYTRPCASPSFPLLCLYIFLPSPHSPLSKHIRLQNPVSFWILRL